MKIISTLLVVAALAILGAVAFAYSGIYDVRASTPHSGLVHWLLSTTSHASIERQSNDVQVPNLSDPTMARAGANDFAAMCVGCHGAPGKDPEAVGQGLNPAAANLAESAEHMNPAELFWVTKHGIKMTGMPSWGATHDDDALWPVVAFMTTLPDLDADGYQALLASAAGMGHHAEGDDTAGHDHDDAPDAPTHDHSTHDHDEPKTEEPPHDDGHEHEH
ncbi:MAG: cytochrome c [Gammaproteobacteria bacterium]|nr:cytochrome c [Gammaproteobacteria bacterium]MDH5620538.1 cytochrome c [Gammaproteobacteria bacterium]